jgi:hypothetical protein
MMKHSLISVLLVAFTLSAGCTQKRQQIFAQGQGTNLDSVESWKEQLIDIDTGDVVGIPSTTNAQDGVKISDSVKVMNHFNIVQIKVLDPKFKTLVGNPPFRGKPNTHGVYQLQIRLSENYLKIQKVAKKEDLPFEEHFYIDETLPDGRVVIPLVGYKIKGFFNIESEKTGDDQNTHHLVEIETRDFTHASHVRIDWSARELFTPVKKLDLFPAELFFARDAKTGDFKPYEWYYSETVTEKSITDTETIVGENNTRTEKSKLSPASKVMFIPREGELRVVNVARDERMSRDQIQHSGDLNSEAALILPVVWKDYAIKAAGTNLSQQGEVVEDRKWSQRQYFEADFPKMLSTAIAEGTTRLLDIEVDQNYLSFTVMNMIGNQGRKIHYSFLRADQGRAPYPAKISVEKDRNTFGFFTTIKPFIENWEYYTKNDFQKRIYMNRMNPEQKEIVFHLSAESPKWLEDIAALSVKAWDKTFEQALGKDKIKITFSPDRVTLGDLRYNVIHLVDTLNEDGLLGFGPSIADPETGEIISASTNVYVNSIQSIAASTVRQYMIDRIEGRLKATDLSGGSILTATDAMMKEQSLSLVSNRLQTLKEILASGKASSADLMKTLAVSAKDAKAETDRILARQCTYAESAALSSNDRDIQKNCPEIEQIIAAKKSLAFAGLDSEKNWEQISADSKDAIRECSKKITRGKLLSTLIHEIGHNFGLRHNFYGSYDKANFKEISTIFGEKVIAHSSSIMEYTDWDEDRLTETGPYDIAAIRFGYGNEVELKDGSKLNVGLQSIASALVDKQKQVSDLKSYLFCTDEEAYTGMNALCRPHDAGTSPKEIVQFFIKQYERNENLRHFRRARPDVASNERVGAYNVSAIFSPMREIYDQWRTQLAQYVKKSNRYLTSYDEKSYQSALDGMKTDSQFGHAYAEYYEASRMVYDFFKNVAFQPNEYCLVDEGGVTRAIEFVTLRDQLSEDTRGSTLIRNCADAQSTSELAKILGTPSPKILSQIGYPSESYRFTPVDTLNDLSDDVLGNSETRKGAFLALASRIPTAQNTLNRFFPSMMDEPVLMSDWMNTYLSRVIQGVDLSAQGLKPQPLFNVESNIMITGAAYLTPGLTVPGDELGSVNQVATNERTNSFTVYRPSQGDDPSEFAAVLKVNNRNLFAAISKDHTVAYQLINQYKQVDHNLSLSAIDENLRKTAVTAFTQALPAEAKADALTVGDFIVMYQAMKKVTAASGDLIACLTSQMSGLAQIDSILQAILPAYAEASKGGDEAITNLVKIPLKTILQANNETSILYTAEAMLKANIEGVSIACTKHLNETVVDSSRFKRDYEAQKSMILKILSIYAN